MKTEETQQFLDDWLKDNVSETMLDEMMIEEFALQTLFDEKIAQLAAECVRDAHLNGYSSEDLLAATGDLVAYMRSTLH